jgi:hypothetical protein
MNNIQYKNVATNNDSDSDNDDIPEVGKISTSKRRNDIDFAQELSRSYIENNHKQHKQISNTTLRNNAPVPISRPPTKHRDGIFAFLFILHFIFVVFKSTFHNHDNEDETYVTFGKAGNWTSMLMIVTLLGCGAGCTLFLLISNIETRETFLSLGLTFSVALQACLGNLLLLANNKFSFLGIFVLISAFIDSYSYKQARENINFTGALIQMVLDVSRSFGFSLTAACISIVAAQTCLLLWWGVFFVELISTSNNSDANIYIIIMAFSLYWITQFFHSVLSFVVGGCVVWYFVKEEDIGLDPSNQVLLYLQCSFTTSFGSLCKGALLCPLSHSILALNHWSKGRPYSSIHKYSLRGLIGLLVAPCINQARRHHKLVYCLLAAYGQTLCKTADEHAATYPETLDIAIEDLTSYTLTSSCTQISGIFAILFGIMASQKEGNAWPMFFFVSFYLIYLSASLVIHTFKGAVDALIVIYALRPERFAKENQIVYLRFLRTTETALR